MFGGKKFDNTVDRIDKMSSIMFLKDKSGAFEKLLHMDSFATIPHRTTEILTIRIFKVKIDCERKSSIRTEKRFLQIKFCW